MEPMQTSGGPEWIPVVLMFARDRSEAGWMFTRVSDVREALAKRQLLAAVVGEGPRAAEEMILARVAVHEDGSLATLPDPAGPPVAGPRIEEVVSELAHNMRTVVSIDGQVAIGTAGVPLEAMPPGMESVTADRRMVHAWPGTDRYVATAAAMGVKEELTWHDADGWTVLASRHAPERVLTGFAPAMERFPRVTLSRKGPERQIEYVAGRDKDDLRLVAWWGPWLEPVVDPAATHEQTRELLEVLAHPRLGQDEMEHHRDLTEEQRLALGEAMAAPDGGQFLRRACAALGVPDIAARLAEQPAGDDDPELLGEPVTPEKGRMGLARAAAKELQDSESAIPEAMQHRVTRLVGLTELVLSAFCLAVVFFHLLPGPSWVWAIVGGLLAGDAIRGLAVEPWRERRRRDRTTAGGSRPNRRE